MKSLEELFKFAPKGFKVLLTLLNPGRNPFILCPVRQNAVCGTACCAERYVVRNGMLCGTADCTELYIVWWTYRAATARFAGITHENRKRGYYI